jgi:hypothetical protein
MLVAGSFRHMPTSLQYLYFVHRSLAHIFPYTGVHSRLFGTCPYLQLWLYARYLNIRRMLSSCVTSQLVSNIPTALHINIIDDVDGVGLTSLQRIPYQTISLRIESTRVLWKYRIDKENNCHHTRSTCHITLTHGRVTSEIASLIHS